MRVLLFRWSQVACSAECEQGHEAVLCIQASGRSVDVCGCVQCWSWSDMGCVGLHTAAGVSAEMHMQLGRRRWLPGPTVVLCRPAPAGQASVWYRTRVLDLLGRMGRLRLRSSLGCEDWPVW